MEAQKWVCQEWSLAPSRSRSTAQGHGFRYSTVGVILMVVGAVGLVISSVVFAMSRRPTGGAHHTYDREVIDPQGRTAAVHEEVR
jgi:hypothetical protein